MLVCDWEVWRHLLKGLTEFSEERLDELVKFGAYGNLKFGIESSPEMVTEVAKEVASRCQKELHLYWADTAEKRRCQRSEGEAFKVTVSLEGWGDPCTFEMAGSSYRQEFNRAAQAVAAKFTIKKLHFQGIRIRIDALRMIARQVEEQGEEGLSKLEFDTDSSDYFWVEEARNIFLSLVEASQEWRIQILWIHLLPDGGCSDWLTELTKSSAKGHIGSSEFYIFQTDQFAFARPKMKFVKAVWEMSEEVKVVDFRTNLPPIGGGRGRDPKITWEEAYETLLKTIC